MKRKKRNRLIKKFNGYIKSGRIKTEKEQLKKSSEIQTLFNEFAKEFAKQKGIKNEKDIKEAITDFITFLELNGIRIISSHEFAVLPYRFIKYQYTPSNYEEFDDIFLMYPGPIKSQK